MRQQQRRRWQAGRRGGFTRGGQAFTLVELLVVIGIIALLISILMPSLNKARQSAKMLSCESNFRQIFNACAFYAQENKGLLPLASTNDWGPEGTNAGIYETLTRLLGKPFKDETKDPISPVFTCTEAADQGAGVVWAPNLIRTVKFNPRAFPGYDQLTVKTSDGLRLEYPQRKLASIKNSQTKIAIFEGPQIPSWNMCPEPESIFLDGWRWSWSHKFCDPPDDGDYSRWDKPLDYGANRDDGWWVCSMRFRHYHNTASPFAFFDGHVEMRKIGEVKVKDICVNR